MFFFNFYREVVVYSPTDNSDLLPSCKCPIKKDTILGVYSHTIMKYEVRSIDSSECIGSEMCPLNSKCHVIWSALHDGYNPRTLKRDYPCEYS